MCIYISESIHVYIYGIQVYKYTSTYMYTYIVLTSVFPIIHCANYIYI